MAITNHPSGLLRVDRKIKGKEYQKYYKPSCRAVAVAHDKKLARLQKLSIAEAKATPQSYLRENGQLKCISRQIMTRKDRPSNEERFCVQVWDKYIKRQRHKTFSLNKHGLKDGFIKCLEFMLKVKRTHSDNLMTELGKHWKYYK